MTKEMIKAIRLVMGFNPNLRVKLDYTPYNFTSEQESIINFLHDNIFGIYGGGIFNRLGIKFNPKPGIDVKDYSKLLDFLQSESRKVCLGEYDK